MPYFMINEIYMIIVFFTRTPTTMISSQLTTIDLFTRNIPMFWVFRNTSPFLMTIFFHPSYRKSLVPITHFKTFWSTSVSSLNTVSFIFTMIFHLVFSRITTTEITKCSIKDYTTMSLFT